MTHTNSAGRRRIAAAAFASLVAMPFLGASPATAQATPAAVSAYGATVSVGGQSVVPPTPLATVATRPGDDTKTVVNIPADPVAVSGTLTATANAHAKADIASGLTVVKQTLAGPYHARGLAQIEQAAVLFGVSGPKIPLLSAAVIRAEAVAVCSATPSYAANSEVVDLVIGGTPVALNAPVQDLIDGITGVLDQTGLKAVVNVRRNVVTTLPGGGITVDALVVTILAAAGDTPLGEVRLARAEVTAGACKPLPQCSDGADNDGDGKIDTADPGCHTDGNAGNPASYDPSDDDETDLAVADQLPRTGGGTGGAVMASGLIALAAAAMATRRKLLA